MKASSRLLAAVLTLVAACSWALPARAQSIDTLSVDARTAWEDGFLSLFNLDRVPQGSRALGMGGAGMALLGGVEYMALNPASLTGIRQVELESEAIFYSGSAGVSSYPQGRLGAILTSSGYRVSPSSSLGYNNVSLGVPVVIFGSRGAFGLSYRRGARTGQAEETRAEFLVVTSANQPVNYGRGDEPEGGLDMFTLSAAREMGSRVSLGANLNFESGNLSRDESLGISLYGFTILSGGSSFTQDVSGVSMDFGARADLGRLKLAATAYLGHDLEFEGGYAEVRPMPDDQLAGRYDLRSRPLDHTLSVPTMLGLGSAFVVNDRLTLAADYMIRPWSDAEITRAAVDPIIGFTNASDSTSFFADLNVSDSGEETFSARFEDTNSLRLGAEYLVIRRAEWNMPLRVGFRMEKLTQTHTVIPDMYAQPTALQLEYFHLNGIPAGTRTEEQQARYEELDGALRELWEFNDLLFRGKGAEATVLSLGLGFDMGSFGAELAVERKSYDIDNFYLSSFNPDPRYMSLVPQKTEEDRSILALSLSTRWRF